MELAKYKACICEGAAENAIMDVLLDNHLLIFAEDKCKEFKKSGKKPSDFCKEDLRMSSLSSFPRTEAPYESMLAYPNVIIFSFRSSK